MPPKYVEDSDSDMIVSKGTNHRDSTNKVKAISPGRSAGYRCLSVNYMIAAGAPAGKIQEQPKKKETLYKINGSREVPRKP